MVGIVVNEPDFRFYNDAVSYIRKELYAADMDAAVFASLLAPTDQQELENSVFSLINGETIDGLIVFAHTLEGKNVIGRIDEIVKDTGMPAVYIDEPSEYCDSVYFDNDECTMLLAEHLVKHHGVKTAAFGAGPEGSCFHDRVRDSFLKSFKALGVEIPESRIYHGLDWKDDYSKMADAIIADGLPDAVVGCSDFTAVSLIGEFAKKGIRVPDDVIVAGYSRGEPFEGDQLNMTSVERSAESVAVNAARLIISKIKGTEYVPVNRPSGRLLEGMSCGCADIELEALSRSAVDNMLQSRRDGFESYYNYMQEDLIGAEFYEDFLWKVDWYTNWLEGISGFKFCVNEGVLHTSGEFESYTDNMYLHLEKKNGKGSVDTDRCFERRRLLPDMAEEREKPCTFVFSCLHFCGTNFGYAVIIYDDAESFIDQSYVKWLRYITGAMEKQRRNILYNDAVADTMIRDSLTGLLNMKGFKRFISDRVGRFDRPDKLLRIISVDIENLRGINDGYGYSEGDRVLQRLAVILNNSAGDDDICVRVSGDEFFIAGILDADLPVDEVPSSLEKNINAFNSGGDTEYGIHIYTSRVTAPLTSPEVLDTLPYEANYQRTLTKDNHNKSRRSVASTAAAESFDPEERKYVAKLLNDNLFVYHFQPIVSAKTGEIYAYEALMRSAGEIKLSPIAILNHAGAMGRLDDIERHTMKNLFEYYYSNSEKFCGRKLFINSIPSCTIPEKEFEELCTKYMSIMDRLVIEFTEQTEASPEQLELVLNRRHKMGFQIAIDDYGTGYSNISNLLTFMPNCVKIDRSLIMNIHEDKRKQHFTKNIIDYAHDNNFRVLAEGVEEPEELKTVIAMGVDLIQGYLTARPSPEVIKSIDWDIAEKIREYNRQNENRQVRKTYFTGAEQEISLMSLDFDNYTDIFVGTESFTLKGTRDHVSNISITIKDGISCRLNLCDVAMAGELSDACITLGKGSRLTLGIEGEVSLAGAVSVPETASLDIVGDGTFSIMSSSNQTYGIGADADNSYGNIGIYLKNRMLIQLNSEKCIGIGGGFNKMGSKINIECRELDIELSGKKVLCIGSSKSDAWVTMKNTRLSMTERCARGIGIGSFDKCMDVNAEGCDINVDFSGDELGGISVNTDKGSSVNLVKTDVKMLFKGKSLTGIGTTGDDVTVILVESFVDIRCEGANAVGIGGGTEKSKVGFYGCSGRVVVVSSCGRAVEAAEGGLVIKDSTVELRNND